jgi:hypothetical protein
VDVTLPAFGQIFEIDVFAVGLQGAVTTRDFGAFVNLGAGLLVGASDYGYQSRASTNASAASVSGSAAVIPIATGLSTPASQFTARIRIFQPTGSTAAMLYTEAGYVAGSDRAERSTSCSINGGNGRITAIRLTDTGTGGGSGLRAGTYVSLRRLS